MQRELLSIDELDRGYIVHIYPAEGRGMQAAAPDLMEALAFAAEHLLGISRPEGAGLQVPTPKGDNSTARENTVPQGLTTPDPQGGDADAGEDDEAPQYGVAAPQNAEVSVPLDNQLANLQVLNDCFIAGKTKSGHPFGDAEWAAGLNRYCPQIDPVHAELIRAQQQGQRREGAGWE